MYKATNRRLFMLWLILKLNRLGAGLNPESSYRDIQQALERLLPSEAP